MNLLDRAISAVSPQTGLKRQIARRHMDILASGYSEHGANHHKGSTKGWVYAGGSSKEDIEDNLPVLRQRSRDLYMGTPLATSAVKTYRTSVVGEGLSVKPEIDAEFLGLSEEQAAKLESEITREWNLWADSTDCDANRLSNFYELQQLAFLNWTMSGDVLATLPAWERPGSPYDLRINLIEADRCMTPPEEQAKQYKSADFQKIVDGVERNRRGEVVAYWISNKHPLTNNIATKQSFVRIRAYGRLTGRKNVLHLMNRERVGQVRGVPLLAPVIETLKQLDRYTEAEIAAAVGQSYWSIFITKENAVEGPPIGEVMPEEAQIDAGDENSIEMFPGMVMDLGEGEKPELLQPTHPSSTFDGFVGAICKQVGAALEIPQELLLKQFTASYSASRGALLEAWKTHDMYRDWMVSGFCEPIYQEWLCEAVAKGRIHAPGFFSDPAIRRAYSGSQWYGPARGILDPKKEVEAAQMRVANGFSTATKETMELTGTDFKTNMATRKREVEMMQEATGKTGLEQTGGTQGQEKEEEDDENRT